MAKREKGVVFSFEHNGTIKFAAPSLGRSHVFNPTDASLETRHFAELKGWKHTIEDAGAKSCDPATGKPPTVEERYQACVDIATYYANKDVIVWGRKAAGGGGRGSDTGLVLQALMNLKGWDVEKANRMVANGAAKHGIERGAYMARLAKEPDIIKEVARVKAERAAKANLDSVSMLNELDALDGDDEDDEDTGEDADE